MISASVSPVAAIILAAGKGTRMKSDLHKVLQPIGGQPMIRHLFDALQQLRPTKRMVVVGDRAEQLTEALADQQVDIILQDPQLGTGHAALQAAQTLEDFDGVVLILFGDVPLLRAATMARLVDAVRNPDNADIAVLGFRPAIPGNYGRILADADGQIERMVEARDAIPEELAIPLCNSGLMAVRGTHLTGWLQAIGNDNAAGEYYLPDIIMLARAAGHRAVVLEGDDSELVGVNDFAELAAAEHLFQQRRRAEFLAAGVRMPAPHTVFFSADTEIAPGTSIEPHVVFGPGVTVARDVWIRSFSHLEGAKIGPECEIGPYARLRPGTILDEGAKIGNFVETKQTALGAGAKANHLTYLGDAEIGANVNIGAGTITCNYDGFGKYRTTIGDGAFIGSNSSLVAPIRIGARAIVGAGSTVTQNVADDALSLERSTQEAKPGWAARFRERMLDRKDKA